MAANKDSYFKSKHNWSMIKDKLLACYLPPYFQKVLNTGKPIVYVDCFAGKGKFEDGNPGSPIIALQIRDERLVASKNAGSGRIETHFIELNHADELNVNITSYANKQVISGKYEEEIETILSSKRGCNVFLYIDPYGIKALDFALFEKFQTYGFKSLEMLINFNSFGFFRDACRVMSVDYINDEALNNLDDLVEYDPTPIIADKQSDDLLIGIANGDYWKAIVVDFKNGKIDGYQAEKRLSTEYKQRLRTKYTYVLDMPIRLKEGNRPKYRMVHVSNHEDGCYLMVQNMLKRKEELFINIQQHGQGTLFDFDSDISSSIENEYVSKESILANVKEHLLNCVEDINYTKFIATFFTEYGLLCDIDMIKEVLTELKDNGSIELIRSPAFTEKGKPSVFWEEKSDKTLTIRRATL